VGIKGAATRVTVADTVGDGDVAELGAVAVGVKGVRVPKSTAYCLRTGCKNNKRPSQPGDEAVRLTLPWVLKLILPSAASVIGLLAILTPFSWRTLTSEVLDKPLHLLLCLTVAGWWPGQPQGGLWASACILWRAANRTPRDV
jgi:hypothetical protein